MMMCELCFLEGITAQYVCYDRAVASMPAVQRECQAQFFAYLHLKHFPGVEHAMLLPAYSDNGLQQRWWTGSSAPLLEAVP